MRTYVINLASAIERRRRMESLLGALGLPFEIVAAVRGNDLTQAELVQFDHRDNMQLGPAEYGCLLSHVKCWNLFLQSGAETALICEDDIHFSPNFSACIATLRVPLNEICLLRLETFLGSATVTARPVQKEKGYGVFATFSPQAGSSAYILNRATAKFLAGVHKQTQHAIDVELFVPNRRSIPPVTVYQVIPAPCIQDMVLTGPSGERFLRSGIGNDRGDIRLGLDRKDTPSGLMNRFSVKGAGEIIKSLLRPGYRTLYSLVLSFSGKRRVKIRYR